MPAKKGPRKGVSTKAKRDDDKRKTLPHLFKPGQSGNPNGRPKGTPNLFNIISAILQEDYEPFVLPNKGTVAYKSMSNAEAVCRMLISKAAEGDDKARTELLNRWAGKVKDEVEHSGAIGGELTEEERRERLNACIVRVLTRGNNLPPDGEDDGGGLAGV